MLTRVLGVGAGMFLILLILASRGLPVLVLLKAFPLLALLVLAVGLIYAGLASDSDPL